MYNLSKITLVGLYNLELLSATPKNRFRTVHPKWYALHDQNEWYVIIRLSKYHMYSKYDMLSITRKRNGTTSKQLYWILNLNCNDDTQTKAPQQLLQIFWSTKKNKEKSASSVLFFSWCWYFEGCMPKWAISLLLLYKTTSLWQATLCSSLTLPILCSFSVMYQITQNTDRNHYLHHNTWRISTSLLLLLSP